MSISNLWAARPRLYEGESLTSWVARLASENAVRPENVRRAIKSTTSIDLSRMPYQGDIRSKDIGRLDDFFASRTGCAGEAIEATLPEVVSGIGPLKRTSRLLLSTQHSGPRTRYCPACLSESRHLKLVWRLSFISVCIFHKCQLRDLCEACGCEVSLKTLRDPGRCPTCSTDLSQMSTKQEEVTVSDSDFYTFVDMLTKEAISISDRSIFPKTRKDLYLALNTKKYERFIRAHGSNLCSLDYRLLTPISVNTLALHWLFKQYAVPHP